MTSSAALSAVMFLWQDMGVVAAPALGCMKWNCSCQEFSDHFRVAHMRSWGIVERLNLRAERKWWIDNDCATVPLDEREAPKDTNIKRAELAPPMCAICFFGLIRGVDPEFEVQRLMDSIVRPNPSCATYAHTAWMPQNEDTSAYVDLKMGSRKAGQAFSSIIGRLADTVTVERINAGDERHNISWFQQFNPMRSGWGPKEMRNMLRQWNSIEQCFALVPPGTPWVAMVRLDVRYEHPMKLDEWMPYASRPRQLVIPDGRNSRDGFNDRFAFGRYDAVSAWASRFSGVERFVTERPGKLWDLLKMQSEHYLKYLLTSRGIDAVEKPMCFTRVARLGKIEQREAHRGYLPRGIAEADPGHRGVPLYSTQGTSWRAANACCAIYRKVYGRPCPDPSV